MGVNSPLDCNQCNDNSDLQCGNSTGGRVSGGSCHILMWDFDKLPLESVEDALKIIQVRYFLSDIHILETNKEEHNHIAYCFTRTEWQRAIEIIAATYGIDFQFLRLSVYRGWFTLRVGAKKSGTPHLVKRLEGYCLADVEPSELTSWVEYETLDRS